jgi:zinc protease
MLFIEAERMTNCLYDPADCESERTVIISELQGGENDPDTLLDQELTAAAFKAHPYRNPVIGWLPDLQTMTRDDLYGHYRRHYVPNNATLVIVGDVDAGETLRRVMHHFGGVRPGDMVRRPHTREPEQQGERRVTVSREGTTAYLKIGYHAPAATDDDFFPMVVLDAVMTGAKGLNLWSSFRTRPPQRSARLYRALVDTGLASSVSGGIVPTQEPFLYTISMTATDGTTLDRLEEAALSELERVRAGHITEADVQRAARQLRARLVFENDCITNIAHQLGYFATIGSWQVAHALRDRIDAVTPEQVAVAAASRLKAANRTIGRFEPLPSTE